ncbi:MAG: hypothetical protein JNK15_20240 [Planctomycetes bacterium]|nr:hypothetical protein [Planctomycetota bacterium]
MRTLTTSLTALMLAMAPAVAQKLTTALRSANVATHDGALHGFGPDYSARFTRDGVTFIPALGRLHPRTETLRFTFTDLRRGDSIVHSRTGRVEPTSSGPRVRYDHTDRLAEVYDVRHDGIEQSFVLAERPRGRGDLVVRGTIATDMPLASATPDGVRFARAEGGGVTFGAVTGIDANGARCRGSLRTDGTSLELSLPASFVDSATYPLTVDPLIGSSFLIANIAGGSDVQPSVAFDTTTQKYLVVWSVPMSASVAEIRAQFVSASGAVGPQLLLASNATAGVRPSVANLNQRNRFAVSWATGIAGILVAVDAANGAVSSAVAWNIGNPVTGIGLGGDSRTPLGPADRVLWVITSVNSISSYSSLMRRRVEIPASGTPVAEAVTFVAVNVPFEIGPPSVTRHAGSLGRWLYVYRWRDRFAPTANGITWTVVDDTGAACDSGNSSWNAPATATQWSHASAATLDGAQFLIAYQLDANTTFLRRAAFSGVCGSGSLSVGIPFVPSGTTGGDDYPDVDCTGNRWVLALRRMASTTSHVHVMSLGLTSGSGADDFAQGPTVATQYDPTVASRWSGGDAASDEALVAWANAGIHGRRWEASTTGSVTNLGGACGISGFTDFASYSGTPVIGTTFHIELLAPTAPVLALVVGFTSNPFACGPCTIVPSPDVLLAGGAPVPVDLPLDANLIGVSLYTQWLQWRQAGCSVLPDFGFSNALRFTIAE